jgi:hypothetical protein
MVEVSRDDLDVRENPKMQGKTLRKSMSRDNFLDRASLIISISSFSGLNPTHVFHFEPYIC